MEDDLGALDERLLRQELGAKVEEFRKMIAEELLWRLAEIRGSDEVASSFHEMAVEDAAFLTASPAELRAMRDRCGQGPADRSARARSGAGG